MSRALEAASMSFESFECFISLQAICWPNFIKFLVMHSNDTGPFDNLGLFGPIVSY